MTSGPVDLAPVAPAPETPAPGTTEETTEITPEQLRSLSIDELVSLLDREGVIVPETVDANDKDAIVDWVISEFGA